MITAHYHKFECQDGRYYEWFNQSRLVTEYSLGEEFIGKHIIPGPAPTVTKSLARVIAAVEEIEADNNG